MKGEVMSQITTMENAAVAIEGKTFSSIGSSEDLLAEFRGSDAKLLDAGGMGVIPGLVDPHTHLIFSGSREFELRLKLEGKSYMDILNAGGGIIHTVSRTRAASAEQLSNEAKQRLNRMLMYGTTTADAKSGYGLDTETEIRSLEVIRDLEHPIELTPTFLGAHAVPPEFKGDPSGYIDHIISDMLPMVAERGLAQYCDVFCEEGVFGVEDSERLLTAAKEHGLKLRAHIDEIVDLGGAQMAAQLGCETTEHLAVTGDEGIAQMAEAGTVGNLLPGTPYSLMSPIYPRARDMIEANFPIALATDMNPNCYTESMQFVMSLGCYMMKMTPAEVLAASTYNAACAVGMEDTVGTIERGKLADLVILDVPTHEHIPYHFGVNHVRQVIKAGEQVVKDGLPCYNG